MHCMQQSAGTEVIRKKDLADSIARDAGSLPNTQPKQLFHLLDCHQNNLTLPC